MDLTLSEAEVAKTTELAPKRSFKLISSPASANGRHVNARWFGWTKLGSNLRLLPNRTRRLVGLRPTLGAELR